MITRSLRKTLIVGAAILALISLLWLRLDADTLSTSFIKQMDAFTDARLTAGKTSLTFIHGMGLRLDQVSLDQADVQMQAKHIIISVRLLPLLLGKIEIDAIDIHDGVFKLKSNKHDLSAASISRFPVPRIHLLRSRIEAANGNILLNHMQLDIRGIGSKHETLWELDAKQGKQTLSGHGRIIFRQGEIESGFGKLKLANMPVAKLQSFAPASLMTWIEGEGNQLSGTLTMDINKHQTWAIFGEMLLANLQTSLAAKVRGKLSHLADGKLVWKDSFIHLGNQAVIAIAGSCEQENCNTTLDAKSIALARWQPFIPAGINFHRNISADTDLMAALQWDGDTWQGKAQLKLKKVRLKQADNVIDFPNLNLDIQELSGSHQSWQATASIRSPKAAGVVAIQSNGEANGDKNMEMTTEDADSALWQPLANLLLSSLHLEPSLQGTGILQASLHIHQHKQRKKLEIDLNASPIQINYKAWINKPADVIATGKVSITLLNEKLQTIAISDLELDTSKVAKLNWSQHGKRQKLNIEQLHLNIEALQALSIPLPDSIADLHGEFSGNFNTAWTDKTTWRNHLNGNWTLHDFGSPTCYANGDGKIKQGIVSSKNLQLKGNYGDGELQGSFNLSHNRGDIDLIAGTLDWSNLPQLPDFWPSISLRGSIKQSTLTLLQNNYSDLHGNYSVAQGVLTLNDWHASLADGVLTGNKLAFTVQTDGLIVQGNVHGQNLQLAQLQGLADWIQADVSGSLQANIKLDGRIPRTGMADWQHSNGDLLIYSGSWTQHATTTTPPPTDLDSKPVVPKADAFKKLEFRFRVHDNTTEISDITIISHEQTYHGKATINPAFHLSGQVQNTADKAQFLLDSNLPQIHCTAQ